MAVSMVDLSEFDEVASMAGMKVDLTEKSKAELKVRWWVCHSGGYLALQLAVLKDVKLVNW